jgi:hypothetical protein
MPLIGHNPSMRIVDSGVFCLRAVILAVLCTLALSGSAYADEQGVPATPSETAEPQSAGETPTGGGGEQSSGEVTGGGSAGGEKAEAPIETPPAIEETAGSTGPSGSEPAETPAVAEPAPQEVLTPPADEESQLTGSATSSRTIAPDAGVAQAVVAHSDATNETSVQSQALIGGPLTPPTAPTARATEQQAPATPAAGEDGGHATLTAAQRAGSLSCELSALGGRSTDNCTAGWLGAKRVLSTTTVSFVRLAGSLAAVSGGGLPPSGGHGGGSAGGNAPVSPTPGPAPSGASGAAVGGGGGVAPSAFLSLAGLLLLAAPRAMRRLRLSCRPLLTACFVLIPERPG